MADCRPGRRTRRKANVNVQSANADQHERTWPCKPESDVAVGGQQDRRGVSRQSTGRAAGRQRSRAGAPGDDAANADPKNHG